MGNPKLKDREFGKALGIPVPKIYASSVNLTNEELVPNSILKPVQGSSSKAVFYVDEALKLHSVRSSEVYDSLEQARTEILKSRGH